MKKIGIVIVATNAYFVLGVKFIKKFVHHYYGDSKIKFYFFSDQDPSDFIPENIDVTFINESHLNWEDATNSKFKNIVQIKDQLLQNVDYVYYFDADTNVSRSFTEEWFLGDLVAGEHYGNRSWLANGNGFDRNPIGHSYVPIDSPLPYTYHYGAFFGGATEKLIKFCETLRQYQIEDRAKGYEPPINDESYINSYFHFNPPTYTVPCDKFAFDISDKGGIGETRDVKLDVSEIKKQMLIYKNMAFNISNNQITAGPDLNQKDKKTGNKILIMAMGAICNLGRSNGIINSYARRLAQYPNIDLIFYSDYDDPSTNTFKMNVPLKMDYSDCTEKTIGAHDLIRERYQNKYDWYFFVDDDTFINIPLLDKMIHLFDRDFVHGMDITGNCDYIPYLSGGAGYIMSNDVMLKMFNLTNYQVNYSDANIGLNLSERGIGILHSNLFYWMNPRNNNNSNLADEINNRITQHYVGPDDMLYFDSLIV